MRIFASASEEPRARRPTDVVLFLVSGAGLVLLAIAASGTTALERDLDNAASQLPGLFDPLWGFLHDLSLVWAVVLVIASVAARRRLSMLRDLVLAGVIASLAATLAYRIVQSDWPHLGEEMTKSGGPPHFPALRVALAAAIIIAASPHLARPLRYVGRWVIFLAGLGTLCLGVSSFGGVLGGLALATAAAALVHLVFGSPGGRPSLDQVSEALAELGIEAVDLQPAGLQPEGVWEAVGRTTTGEPLTVKVYGRDAWDGQFAISAWRFVWYRNGARSPAFTRTQQVEHEAFLILLAARANVCVPTVLAAGRSETGDALLVVSADATALSHVGSPSDDLLVDLWASLDRAHATGVSPGQIDPTRVGRDAQGRAMLLDWVAGATAPTNEQVLQDRAQLLVSTALVVGQDQAIASALLAIGEERLTQLLPYLQPASLTPTLRRMLRERHIDVDDIRAAASHDVGVDVPELVRIRRVTVGSLVQAGLLLFAALAMVQALTSVDLAEVGDEFRTMAIGAVLVCFALAIAARSAGTLSNLGASPVPLPVGPLLQLQFAIAYINMAVPSSAARVAIVMRFYQRVGSTATTALGASALDSFSNFLVQVTLVVVTLVFGLGSLQFDFTSASSSLPSDLFRFVVILGVGLVVAAVIGMFIPAVRHRVLPMLGQFRQGLNVLHSPTKIALLIGGNLLVQVLYALSLGAATEAMGYTVGLFDLLLIINLVGTFASMIPVPNGMGVTEAGLTAGLVAAGVPSSAALAAALLYRILSSYLPPIWGFFAMRSLQRQHYL